MSRYEADDTYCMPGTTVLKNKAGITDQNLLDEFEGDFTTLRIIELSEQAIDGDFDLDHLCKIHAHIFQDVYDWAGMVRTVDIVRGDSRFCNARLIASYANKVFTTLKDENHLRRLGASPISQRLAHYLSEINAIHPFREGNGRVQRLFIAQLAEQAGFALDYSALNQADVYPIMQASFTGDERPLAVLILSIISES
jgi:cell filamentation protein